MCKLNTCRIVKTYSFCFLCNYYGDSINVMLFQFPNHFLLFPMVFPYDFLGCFYCFLSVFLLFPILDFVICTVLHVWQYNVFLHDEFWPNTILLHIALSESLFYDVCFDESHSSALKKRQVNLHVHFWDNTAKIVTP